jgi:Mrp family chromosome partitioning ATPase/uncharacterized protein involved in exopolysaccharide biosynthesis
MTNKTPDQLLVADNNQEWELSRFDMTMQMLRGRWTLVAILALIGAVAGGFAGFKLPKPIYRSEGIVEIKPVVPKILTSDDSKDLRAQFEGYISQQVALLNSKEVKKQAMMRDEWQQVSPGTAPGFFVQFDRNAAAERPARSQSIEIYYNDVDPVVAQKGVEAMAKAYEALIEKKDEEDKAQVYDIVVKEHERLLRELEDARHEIKLATNEVGADSLKAIYLQKVHRLERLEEELDQIRMTLIAMDELSQGANRTVTLQLIASNDAELRRLLRDRYLVQREMTRLGAEYGMQHVVMRQQKLVLANLEDQINMYVQEVTGKSGTNGSGEALRLRAQEKGLESLVGNVNIELARIGRKELGLSQLRDKEKDLVDKVKLAETRIEDLTIDAAASGRIKVLSYGDTPASPYSDRRKLACVAGIAFGGMLGFGIVLFIAWLDPSIRNMDDLEITVSDFARLGVLPQLPDDLTDAEAITTAAHCVHNIRTKMMISSVRDNNHVFAVTSCGPASGKSSLAMALGLSFSGTGGRTLLIDCDLVAGGLSRRVEDIIPTQSRHPLVKAGLVNEAQLNRARIKSQEEGRFLVEVLVEAGDLQARDADRASKMLEASNRGLLDVMNGDNIEDCVLETEIPNLYVLAIGNATEHDISRLSLTGIQRVFEAAREKFDNVIVDTGPTPGSAEAALVTAAADGTVVVVTRGEDRLEVKRATNELRRNNVHVLGIVYNRADDNDMELSGATSVSRRSNRPTGHSSLMVDDSFKTSKIGGLGSSVAMDSGHEKA